MKITTTTIILWLAAVTLSNAQQVFIQSYTEQTHISPKVGAMLGYEFNYGYEMGVFYQKEVSINGLERAERPTLREEEFFGILFAGPIVLRDRYNVKINARTGIRNNFSFVISPSVVGNYRLTRNLQVQLGIGVRTLRPTLQAGLKVGFGRR